MEQDTNKARQEASLVGRILSMEAFLLLMGVASLIYGVVNGAAMNIFWAIVIIPGVFILSKVKKKDWKKHWEELEAEQKAKLEWMNRQKMKKQNSSSTTPPQDKDPNEH